MNYRIKFSVFLLLLSFSFSILTYSQEAKTYTISGTCNGNPVEGDNILAFGSDCIFTINNPEDFVSHEWRVEIPSYINDVDYYLMTTTNGEKLQFVVDDLTGTRSEHNWKNKYFRSSYKNGGERSYVIANIHFSGTNLEQQVIKSNATTLLDLMPGDVTVNIIDVN